MSNYPPPLFFLVLFVIGTLPSLKQASQDASSEHAPASAPMPPLISGCPPALCGSKPVQIYPFSLPTSSAYCGYPELKLLCIDGDFIVQSSTTNYIVTDIDATLRTVTLHDTDLLNSSCPMPRYNLTYDQTHPLYYTSHVVNYTFYYNCLSDRPNPIACLHEKVSGNSYLVPPGDQGKWQLESECSYWVDVPTKGYNSSSEDPGIKEVAERGFELAWDQPSSQYGDCERSGGWCAFNPSTGSSPEGFGCMCTDGEHRSNCDDRRDRGTSSTRALAIKLGIGAAVVLLILSAFLLLYFGKCCIEVLPNSTRKAEEKTVEEFLMRDQLFAVKRYKFSELKQITASFSETLGRGGFATVYKGKLRDGTPVAVKLLKDSRDTGEEFINEVASIGRTNHVNVVRLLGFCSAGPKRRALVYEFMPNGSLEKFLFNVNVGASTPAPTVVLDWEKLHGIAVGIARGLEYLHRGCNTMIVHLDIKPHNILLDSNMQPKISDFGLARLCRPMASVLSSAIGARGTIGYIAPEVFSRTFGYVSGKSDVYSYGMMLLEMAGRRRNVRADARNSSEVYFPHWIYEHLDEYYGLEACENSWECEIARKMVLVGLWCIQMDPSARPSIVRVVEMLETAGVEELEMPPKPYMCSPDRSGRDLVAIDSSSTFETSGSRSC